ncbi:TadE family type IV pilus minor pilin [Spongiactinospora sp. TRM90649]|uniref:TadE family type IV pilus minor pilin n=1 Tax=Spongiactinospora sp. TRM90649 TaxID=3031114 RepID=UPI0023F96AD4|nr:TadE family type IV pilus minor pilin [Spongiactinospora sp. TRM90649]MDF5754870.1 TadE family type IV pilus minor pilin [Spongiactinospora sp. TRM90649]
MSDGRRRSACGGSRGSVTAETAAVLPSLVVVLAAAMWAVAVVGAQLECVDAARAGARAAARGESLDRVRELAADLAPEGAQIAIRRDVGTTVVTVSARVRPKWGERLPTVSVGTDAVAVTEEGVVERGGMRLLGRDRW